jgi:hypothetical protein
MREETGKRVNKEWTQIHKEHFWESKEQPRTFCCRTTEPAGNVNGR